MATLGETWKESLRLTRASERLNALAWMLVETNSGVLAAAKMAPELEPELAAMQERLAQMGEHLEAAVGVLGAKLDNLEDELSFDCPRCGATLVEGGRG